MKPWFFVSVVAVVAASPARAVEQSWEIRGEFVALKAGEPEVVVLRLADGRTLEVPLESLAAPAQAAARRAAAAGPPSAPEAGGEIVTVRGPFGKPVRVSVPEIIKDVEADAIHCRTAAEAADVYRLFLADERITPESRAAAQARAREWVGMADQGLVRFGDRWVSPAEAQAAAAEATKVVDHALGLMRLGNGDLAEEELRKAARIDPESSRAHFVAGLAYALAVRNPTKAADQFTEAMRRSPDDPAILGNVAALEVLARRYTAVARHFRNALETAVDPGPVVENVAWAVKLAGDAKVNPALAKSRMPDKTVDELNALYRTITQDLGLKPPASVSGPRFVDPRGVPCGAATVADVARQVEAAGAPSLPQRRALGFVVAPGHVVCPREAVTSPDGTVLGDVTIELPTDRGRRRTATIVAAPKDTAVALLKCDGLEADPLPLATTMPPLPVISAVGRAGDSGLTVQLSAARGKVMTPALEVQARGRFVHTAMVPRGPGGGPILDESGRVVGMVAATPRTDASGNVAGFGIPVERIWPVIKDHLPDVEAAGNRTAGGDAAVAERHGVAGTVGVSASRVQPANGGAPQGPP